MDSSSSSSSPSSSNNDFIPSQVADDMQRRTRKERKFDEVEATLQDPEIPRPQGMMTSSSLGGLLNRISKLNLFGRPIARGDVVWLLDNTAYKHSRLGPWQAEFVAAVFENEEKCRVVDIVASVAEKIGLADDAEERDTVEERLLPFTWDIRAARTVTTVQDGDSFRIGPTGTNGIATNIIKLSRQSKGTFVKTTAKVADGVQGILTMNTYFAGPEGWGIISDIDDTIKVTTTSDPAGILRETFANDPAPVAGMPELYSDIKSFLPSDTPWFYLSASPYNLYPFLKQFRDDFYPPGTLILRDSSWKTVSGLLSALTMRTEEYKVDRMHKVNSWLPKRKLIVIGDSTQSDPEAYGEMYRTKPGWIKLILIRKVIDSAAVGLEEKNEPRRFERAFRGIPRDAWYVFEDPRECLAVVKDTVRSYS